MNRIINLRRQQRMSNAHLLKQQRDRRRQRIVFLAHCILNENTRYLGGECRVCCVRKIVEQCIGHDLGMVQMPCPEQVAWGGVTKRCLLLTYGSKRSVLYRLRHILLPLALWRTRKVHRCLARMIADQIADYLDSGYAVVGIVGVDGSPSCGVATGLNVRQAVERLAQINPASVTAVEINAIMRSCAHASPPAVACLSPRCRPSNGDERSICRSSRMICVPNWTASDRHSSCPSDRSGPFDRLQCRGSFTARKQRVSATRLHARTIRLRVIRDPRKQQRSQHHARTTRAQRIVWQALSWLDLPDFQRRGVPAPRHRPARPQRRRGCGAAPAIRPECAARGARRCCRNCWRTLRI